MSPDAQAAPASKKMVWTGRILSALPVLLLLFSASGKLMRVPQVTGGFTHLGWPASIALAVGILELSCTIIYVIPRTAILGAILLTGYMGGAVATHVRIGEPFILQVMVGVVAWAGLYLRDERVRKLIPLRS